MHYSRAHEAEAEECGLSASLAATACSMPAPSTRHADCDVTTTTSNTETSAEPARRRRRGAQTEEAAEPMRNGRTVRLFLALTLLALLPCPGRAVTFYFGAEESPLERDGLSQRLAQRPQTLSTEELRQAYQFCSVLPVLKGRLRAAAGSEAICGQLVRLLRPLMEKKAVQEGEQAQPAPPTAQHQHEQAARPARPHLPKRTARARTVAFRNMAYLWSL